MRGISEERLIELCLKTKRFDDITLINHLVKHECVEIDGWKPIDGNTPKDRLILVYAPGRHGLDYLISPCKWHDDAGFCVDELRYPTHWQELPPLPKEQA